MLFNGKVKNVIDCHLHASVKLRDDDGNLYLNGYDSYIEENGFRGVCINSLPSAVGAENNVLVAFCKMVNKKIYAHGGFAYPSFPANNPAKDGFDIATQYKELMEIGFDGIKMLETKPSQYKKIAINLDSDFYDEFFTLAEKDKTHLLIHANDPEKYWDKTPSEHLVNQGWWYGDGTYTSNEDVYRHIENILERHPDLTATFAHFFFLSEKPEKLSEYFEKYKNMGVDLTPGGEMYFAFEARKEYYKEFMTKYSDRIIFGTDGEFHYGRKVMDWLADRVYRYVATGDTFMAFNDVEMQGFDLDAKAAENILSGNFIRKVGAEPKPINKKALKAYIEKYRPIMVRPEAVEMIDKLSKELL